MANKASSLNDLPYKEVIEVGQFCRCGGVVDRRYQIQQTPDVWMGKCFKCGNDFTVVNVNGGIVTEDLVLGVER